MIKLLKSILELLQKMYDITLQSNSNLVQINANLVALQKSTNVINGSLGDILTELEKIDDALQPGPPTDAVITFGIPTQQ